MSGPSPHAATRALTLVEVAIAIGVAAFCLLAVLALLPAGINSVRDSADELAALSLAQAITLDIQNTPGNGTSPRYRIALPPDGPPITNFLNRGGDLKSASDAHYRFVVTVESRPTNSWQPRFVHITASWPAAATNPIGSVETVGVAP